MRDEKFKTEKCIAPIVEGDAREGERKRERGSENANERNRFSHCPLNWANCQPAGSPLAVHFRPENRSIQLVTRLSRVGLRATQIEGCVPLALPFDSRQPELGTPEPAAL